MRWFDSLRRPSAFVRVRRSGRRASVKTLTAYLAEGGRGLPRVGITASRDVGNAVVRNLARRRVQGALDGLSPEVRPPVGSAIVVVLRPSAAAASSSTLAADVAAALARAAEPRHR